MILSQEQTNRYLRHIIIPEISNTGQKKLLDSAVTVEAESVAACASLLYYMAAAGVGNISCNFKEKQGYEILFNNVRDLNNDISISLNDKTVTDKADLRIITGSPEYAANSLSNPVINQIPVIMAMNRGWEGYIQVFKSRAPMESIASNILNSIQESDKSWDYTDDSRGKIFSACLLGSLIVIETIKLLLDIGTTAEKPLSFDLLSMTFYNHPQNMPDYFFHADSDSNSGTGKRLADCKVLVVGTGGLGSPAAYALVQAGIGTIGLVDNDTVDISNLNRQFLHSVSRIGLPKVDSAEKLLLQLNPRVNIIKYHTNFSRENAFDIMADYDVMIDGVDNFPARYLLNDACYFLKKPMVEAGVLKFDGMGMTIIPDEGMCYRCLCPALPEPGSVPSCSQIGILGPVPGVMGFIEACEAAKLLTGRGRLLKDSLLSFDALDLTFDILQAGKTDTCPLCGTNPSIKELQGYDTICES